MKTIVFDLEVQNSPDEVPGGWDNKAALGISSGVAWISWEGGAGGRYRIFRGERILLLADLLGEAEVIVGFNSLGFDLPLLSSALQSPISMRRHLALQVDLMVMCHKVLGWNPSLDRLALATLGDGKNGHGQHAPILAQEGRWDELHDYNLRDVELTKRLYEFAHEHGYLLIEDGGSTRRIPLQMPGADAAKMWEDRQVNKHDLSPGTPKQIQFIRQLYRVRGIPVWEPMPGLSKSQASEMIQQMQTSQVGG